MGAISDIICLQYCVSWHWRLWSWAHGSTSSWWICRASLQKYLRQGNGIMLALPMLHVFVFFYGVICCIMHLLMWICNAGTNSNSRWAFVRVFSMAQISNLLFQFTVWVCRKILLSTFMRLQKENQSKVMANLALSLPVMSV